MHLPRRERGPRVATNADMPIDQAVHVMSMRARAALMASLLITVPALAHAQDAIVENAANEDMVRLMDGSSLRGHVILTHPGCDLTLSPWRSRPLPPPRRCTRGPRRIRLE
jgi:hypothetical protein